MKSTSTGKREDASSEGAVRELPATFIAWQIDSRARLFDDLLNGRPVSFLAGHLPVLASQGADGGINLANKGLGLVPRDEHLLHYTRLYREALAASEGRPWDASLAGRIDAARALLRDPEHIDPRRLGSLEIFEGRTLANIRRVPRVALLFTGMGPEYLSFQIDADTCVLGPGHAVYEFLVASRMLFGRDAFHVAQPGYPHAYEFRVRDVRDKRPRSRCPVG